MNLESRYRAACDRADAAKGRLHLTAEEARARITPARLRQDAKDRAGAAVSNSIAQVAAKARQRPVAIGAAATAFGLFVFRRPLAALFGRLYVRFKNRPELSETDNG